MPPSREEEDDARVESEQRVERPVAKVCLACRAIKIRCNLPPGSPPGSTCARCIRLDLSCVYQPRASRLKKHKERQISDHHSGESAAQDSSPPAQRAVPGQSPSATMFGFVGTGESSSGSPAPRGEPNGTNASHHPVFATGLHTAPRNGEANSSLDENLVLSFKEVAEATVARHPKLLKVIPSAQALPMYTDPVDLHLLSELEAVHLCNYFHSHLNPCIKSLDANLHTPAYIRSTSRIMYTATLAVAAKFIRRDIYPQLLAHAQQLVAKGLSDSAAHIGLVHALCMLTYWKEDTDSSAWMKVGVAIRMGYQLRLHSFTRPLPDNVDEARLCLDRERLWLNLICFDYSYHLHGNDGHLGTQPGSMTFAGNLDLSKWVDEVLPFGVTDDIQLAASAEMCQAFVLSRTLEKIGTPEATFALANHLDGLLQKVYTRYMDDSSPLSRLIASKTLIQFHWFSGYASVGRSAYISSGLQDTNLLARYLTREADVVRVVLAMIDERILNHAQDTVATTLFTMAEFFAKIFPKISSPDQATLVRWMTQLYQACSTAKDGNEQCVAAYLARFFRKVLRTIAQTTSSRPMTRAASPHLGARASEADTYAGTGQWALPAAFNQLEMPLEQDLFPELNQAGSVELNGLTDTTFWEALFPGYSQDAWAWLEPTRPQLPPDPAAFLAGGPGDSL